MNTQTNKKKSSILEMKNKSYLIEKDLDQGISGSVKLLVDSKDSKKYVAKIMRENSLLNRLQFLNEIQILKELSNEKYIVKYIYSGKCNLIENGKLLLTSYCIILEYLPNKSLIDYLMNPKFSSGFGEFYTKLIFYYIIEAIIYLHKEKNIANRDIKPENIVFNSNFIPIIIDYGVARKFDSPIKDPFLRCGSVSYRAPEVSTITKNGNLKIVEKYNFFGRNYNPFKADIFSLGITIFFTICGKNIFQNMEIFDKNKIKLSKLPKLPNIYFEYITEGKFEEFWKFCEKENIFFSELSTEFKELFIKMVNVYPYLRPTATEVFQDKWFDEIRNMDKAQLAQKKNELKELLESTEF